MLVLTSADVERLLDLDRLVDAVGGALADLSAGRASMPPRIAATIAERDALLAVMPAFLPSAQALTTKLVSLFPQNRDRPTHQAVIVAFEPTDGSPLALMDGTYITAARTAAASALATRLLARPEARTVAIVGTGVQARSHAIALARDPRVETITVAGRDDAAVERLVANLRGTLGERVRTAPSIEEAVRAADIVCTTTHAAEPVVQRGWLRPGAHVNSVGYNTAGRGELDGETIRDALVVVESRAGALAPPPAGAVELYWAIEYGYVTAEHVQTELGDLYAGRATGRTGPAQLTVYKGVGVAVEDAAAAALVLEAARTQGVGTTLEI